MGAALLGSPSSSPEGILRQEPGPRRLQVPEAIELGSAGRTGGGQEVRCGGVP